MFQKGLTILLVTFLLISLCFVAEQVGSSEKNEETSQRSGETIESIEKSIQDLKIVVLQYELRSLQPELKELRQETKALKNEVKKGNKVQIIIAVVSLFPISGFFLWGYKKIRELWRTGEVSDQVLAILYVALALVLTMGLLSLVDFYLF